MKRNRVWMAGLVIAVAGVYLAVSLERSKRPAAKAESPQPQNPHVLITISKQTTFITEPLRKDGYVDYVAALNQRFQAGVTLENNAAVPFLKRHGARRSRSEVSRRVLPDARHPAAPEKGDYYVTLDKCAQRFDDVKKPPRTPEERLDIYWERLTQAMKRPWSKKEFPIFADWLTANEKPLAMLVTASKRPRRYDPLISGDDSVIGILLPAMNRYREAARALAARAMLRMDEGKVDEVWQDLLACHRLARLAGQGPTLVEALVAIAVDKVACAGDQGLLQHARLAPAQIARMRAELDKLPPLPKMVDKINVGERFMYLDSVGVLARKGISTLAKLSGASGATNKPEPLIDSAAREAIDFDQVLRMNNPWYDRMADALGKPTRAERQKALGKIDDDIAKLVASAKDWKSQAFLMLSGPRNATSVRIGQILMCLLLPAVRACATPRTVGRCSST